jgi:hypothetical protein
MIPQILRFVSFSLPHEAATRAANNGVVELSMAAIETGSFNSEKAISVNGMAELKRPTRRYLRQSCRNWMVCPRFSSRWVK